MFLPSNWLGFPVKIFPSSNSMNDGIGCDHAMSWKSFWQLLSPARCLTLCRSPSGAWCSSTSWTLSRLGKKATPEAGTPKTSKNWMLILRKTAANFKSHQKMGKINTISVPVPEKRDRAREARLPYNQPLGWSCHGKANKSSVGMQSEYKSKKTKSKNTGNHRFSYYNILYT